MPERAAKIASELSDHLIEIAVKKISKQHPHLSSGLLHQESQQVRQPAVIFYTLTLKDL